jgi:hypothetical protein
MARDRRNRQSPSAFQRRAAPGSSFHRPNPVKCPKKRGKARKALIARGKPASGINPQDVDHAQLYRPSNVKAIGRHRQPRWPVKHGPRRADDKAHPARSEADTTFRDWYGLGLKPPFVPRPGLPVCRGCPSRCSRKMPGCIGRVPMACSPAETRVPTRP